MFASRVPYFLCASCILDLFLVRLAYFVERVLGIIAEMASVQQLEKLYQVKKIFQADRSLESVVASNHVEDALRMTETLIKQRAFLREERRRLRIATEKLEERKRAMGFISQPDFIGDHFKISDGSRKIRINVGSEINSDRFRNEVSLILA